MFEFSGYKEAHKIDSIINKLLTDNSPSQENKREWRLFVRTIQSSLDLISDAVIERKQNAGKKESD